jgi:hypothetical protein
MKIIEIKVEGKGGLAFDFKKFDIPDIKDALDYMLGYVGGVGLGNAPNQNPEAKLRLSFPDFCCGWDHGVRVLRGETRPAWHSAELDFLSLFVKCGAMSLDALKEILHDRAIEAGMHDCSQHNEDVNAAKNGLTGTEELKA